MNNSRIHTSPLGPGSLPRHKKRASIEGSPVLFSDNNSSGSDPKIELLTINEVAGFLKISVSGVRRLQQARFLPFMKVGGSVRFLVGDLVSYLEKQRVEPVEQ